MLTALRIYTLHMRHFLPKFHRRCGYERHVLYFDTIAINHRNRINICLTTRLLMWWMCGFNSHPLALHFINLKCFTCARSEDIKSLSKAKRLFKKKGSPHIIQSFFLFTHTHTHAVGIRVVNGLEQLFHVNRMFLFRFKINHVPNFFSILIYLSACSFIFGF